jgi:hypothetical protein
VRDKGRHELRSSAEIFVKASLALPRSVLELRLVPMNETPVALIKSTVSFGDNDDDDEDSTKVDKNDDSHGDSKTS